MSELIRAFEADGFELLMFDTGKTDARGQTTIKYTLHDRDELIFEGEDFHCSPLHADDSDESVAALVSFLTLRPGDTDLEYFLKYTERQLEWCQSDRCEELSMLAATS